MKRGLIILLGLVVLIVAVWLFSPQKGITTPVTPSVKVKDQVVQVTIARSDEQMAKGLSKTPKLDENEGMLFLFKESNIKPSFWMKEMLFDLDMIWIDDNRVAYIHKNVPKPQPGQQLNQLLLYTPQVPTDAVLEVRAGFSDRHNIEVGDNVDLYGVD